MFPTQISCSCVDKGERQSSIWVVKWKRPGSRRTTPNTARMREAYAIKVPENKPMSAWQRSEGPACCEVQALYGQGLLLEWELPWSGRVENLDLAMKNLESWTGYEHLSPRCLKTKLFWLKGHALVHRKTNLGMHVFGEGLQVLSVLGGFSGLISLASDSLDCNSSVLFFSSFFFNCSQTSEHTSSS